MGYARFRAFDVGAGDCIFLLLSDGENQFSIMVDCGEYRVPVKQFIKNDLNNHIDLLIITHIDNDHIDGIREMLSENDTPEISHILFNCAQLTRPDVLPTLLPKEIDLQNLIPTQSKVGKRIRNVSARSSLSLASIISKKIAYKEAWAKQYEYITNESDELVLPDGFGKIIFLSPEKISLGRLDNEFRKAFIKTFYMKYEGPYDTESTIYELIIRGLTEDKSYKAYTSSAALSTASLKNIANLRDEKISISASNKASIAFIWECNDKRILFCGDADPEIIVYNYLCKHLKTFGYETFEAIKVPHHGSAHNCGGHFWETFDSNHIFITGNSNDGHRPSKTCLAKIVLRPTENCRTIHYTHKETNLDWLDSNPEVRNQLNYCLSDKADYEFKY